MYKERKKYAKSVFIPNETTHIYKDQMNLYFSE